MSLGPTFIFCKNETFMSVTYLFLDVGGTHFQYPKKKCSNVGVFSKFIFRFSMVFLSKKKMGSGNVYLALSVSGLGTFPPLLTTTKMTCVLSNPLLVTRFVTKILGMVLAKRRMKHLMGRKAKKTQEMKIVRRTFVRKLSYKRGFCCPQEKCHHIFFCRIN